MGTVWQEVAEEPDVVGRAKMAAGIPDGCTARERAASSCLLGGCLR